MIRSALKTTAALVVLGALAYAAVFVPLGERTLYQHLGRIADTEEAEDLGREAGEATDRAGDHLRRKWDALNRDAGMGTPVEN